MAETMSVRAILSAVDHGFTSVMNSARKTVSNIGSTVKSGLGFGVLAGVGMSAFNSISNGARDLITEIDSSNAAWKTFEQNMAVIEANGGKLEKSVSEVKTELQDFAQKTVYSSSDMASTYAQLAAVGTKNTDKLVTGFGGLAAAAENPQQAMKTLSMQATQMAAKPSVAWADFKLMLEQTPAGIAAVAKQMGMSTQELVTAVQDGEVKTEEFFKAIEEVGNSPAFYNMATKAKTVGQAMDGLKETLANKLTPAFDVLSQYGIKNIESLSDKIAEIPAEELADKVASALEKAQPYIDMAKNALIAVGGVLKKVGSFLLEHSDVISKVIPVVLALVAAYKAFKIVNAVVPAVAGFANNIAKLATGGISSLGGKLMQTASGVETVGKKSSVSSKQMLDSAKAFMMLGAAVLMIAAGFGILAYSAIQLADAGGVAIGVMFGLVAALAALGFGMAVMLKSIASVGAQAMPAATAMLVLGAAVVLVAAGFAILAYSAIQLSSAGGAAIAVMAGLVVALAGLMVLAAVLAPAMTAGAVGFIAFGAAIALVGVGALLAAVALQLVAGVLPIVCQYGFQGAAAIALLGAGMLAFAVGAAAAGAACVVLAAGLVLIGASVIVVAAGVLALSAAVLILAAGAITLGAGLMVCAMAFTVMAATLPPVAANSMLLVASFTLLTALSIALGAGLMVTVAAMIALTAAAVAGTAGIVAFGAGMLAACAGVLAMNAAIKGVANKMKTISSSAKSSVSSFKAMSSAAKATKTAISSLASAATTSMNQITSAMNSAAAKAQSAGQKLGTGFTNGMRGGLSPAPAIASSTVAAISAIFMAGYGRAYSAGAYIGQGLANGMQSMLGRVRSIANQLVNEANRAIEAKARIGSPSKITTQYGKWYGEGYVNGIEGMARKAAAAAKDLVSFPNMNTLSPAMAFSGDLSTDYDYYRNAEFVIDVPLTVDGKEFARATASYTEEELNKRQARNERKRGRV